MQDETDGDMQMAKYIMIRAIAFCGLTSISTMVLALPYMA